MLFPRRTWAKRVIEKMGLPAGSEAAPALIDLLIWASKQDTKMMNSVAGFSLPVRDLILSWAISMHRNRTAVDRLSEILKLPFPRAAQLLTDMSAAGQAVAKEQGLDDLLKKHEQAACRVHILQAGVNGPRTVNWIIGEQINRAEYDRFKDEYGELYVAIGQDRGEQQVSIVDKQEWLATKKRHFG